METVLIPVKNCGDLLSEENSFPARLLVANTVTHRFFVQKSCGKLSSQVFSKWSQQGSRITLHLKELYCHDDRQLTAEDIAFSLLRPLLVEKTTVGQEVILDILGASLALKGKRYRSNMVQGVKVTHEDKLEIVLKNNNPFFLKSLCALDFLVSAERFHAVNLWGYRKYPQGIGDFWHWTQEKTGQTFRRKVPLKNCVNAVKFSSITSQRAAQPNTLVPTRPKNADLYMKLLPLSKSVQSLFLLFNFESSLFQKASFRHFLRQKLRRKQLSQSAPQLNLTPLSDPLEGRERVKKQGDGKRTSQQPIVIATDLGEENQQLHEELRCQLSDLGFCARFMHFHPEKVPTGEWDLRLTLISHETPSPLLPLQSIAQKSRGETHQVLKNLTSAIEACKACDGGEAAAVGYVAKISQFVAENAAALPLANVAYNWYAFSQSGLSLRGDDSPFLNLNQLRLPPQPPRDNPYRRLFEEMVSEHPKRGRRRARRVFCYQEER